MDSAEVSLSGAQETMLATLYLRALESRSPHSILGDDEAARAVRRVDYDFRKLRLRNRDATAVAIRAYQFDEWTRQVLAAEPGMTVLHLGCGLDSRAFRITPPDGVRWYDVDLPDVIELRRKLYSEHRSGYRTLARSATDPALLDQIPGDLPVLVVAEGLTMYLSEEDGIDLVRRITEHFPRGTFVFDALNRLGVRLSNRFNRVIVASGSRLKWGIDDPEELETAVPGLNLDREWAYTEAPELARYPWLTQQTLRAVGHVTSFRRMGRILRYSF